jgi:hypothetical protein
MGSAEALPILRLMATFVKADSSGWRGRTG